MSFLIAIEDLAKAVKAAEKAVSHLREAIAFSFRTRPPSPYHSISLCECFVCVSAGSPVGVWGLVGVGL